MVCGGAGPLSACMCIYMFLIILTTTLLPSHMYKCTRTHTHTHAHTHTHTHTQRLLQQEIEQLKYKVDHHPDVTKLAMESLDLRGAFSVSPSHPFKECAPQIPHPFN